MANRGDASEGDSKDLQPIREAEVLWLEPPQDRPDVGTLTGDQHQVAKQIHSLLKAMARRDFMPRAQMAEPFDFLAEIDETRRNHNVLIDGGRGSGKTALLVTLLDLWTAKLRRSRTSGPEAEARAADLKNKGNAWGWSDDLHFVPLRILDLQPIPEHIPVLLHIAERLARVIPSLDGDERIDSPPPWHLSDAPEFELARRWRALLQCIVAQWDESSSARWARKDDEAMTVDLDRGVREQHDLPTQFARFMDELTKSYQKRYMRDEARWPLFIVPIDDADLAVRRIDETLEAMRMLSHPRLAFLLTGDTELVDRAVVQRARKRLKDDASAARLGDAWYEKAIPHSQRCHLPAVTWSERLRMIRNVLALQIKAQIGSGEHTIGLHDLLNPAIVRDALPSYPRALRDLNALASARPGDRPGDALARVVLHLWRRSKPPPEIRDYVSVILYGNRVVTDITSEIVEGGVQRDQRIETHSSPRELPMEITLYGFPVEGSLPLNRGDADGPPFEVVTRNVYSASRSSSEQRSQLAALTLADLVAFLTGVPRRGEKTQRGAYQGMFAWGRYKRRDPREVHDFAWPFPEGLRLIDLSVMSVFWDRVWGDFIREPAREDAPDRAARWFVTLIAQLRLGPLENPWRSGKEPADPPSWISLFHSLNRLLYGLPDDPMALSFQAWARVGVLLLAAPESGLSVSTCREIIGAYRTVFKTVRDKDLSASLEQQRSERIAATLRVKPGDGRVNTLIEEFNKLDEGHPWRGFVASLSGVIVESSAKTLFVRHMVTAGLFSQIQQAHCAAVVRGFSDDLDGLLLQLANMARSLGTRYDERFYLAKSIWDAALGVLRSPSVAKDAIVFNRRGMEFTRDESLLLYVDYGKPSDVRSCRLRPIDGYSLGRGGKPLKPLLSLLYESFWDIQKDITPKNYQPIPMQYVWTWSVVGVALGGIEVPWAAPRHVRFDAMRTWHTRWAKNLPELVSKRAYSTDNLVEEERILRCYLDDLSAPLLDTGTISWANWTLDYTAQRVLEKLYQQQSEGSEFDELARNIVHGIALLLTPESALAKNHRDILLTALQNVPRPRPGWEPTVESLVQLRSKRVVAALKWAERDHPSAEALLREWDASTKHTHWNDYLQSLRQPPSPKS